MRKGAIGKGLLALILGLGIGPATAADNAAVTVGVNGLISDAPFYIADKNGYFKEQSLDVKFVSFASAAMMVAPLSTGQLDVGGGAVSVGLFNAAARGIKVRIVADRASTTPLSSYIQLLVRKDLYDSGKVKDYRDLKGLRIGANGIGVTGHSTINEALLRGGLTYDDVQHVDNMPPSQTVSALQNKAVDAILTTEPIATMAIEQGIAVRLSQPDLYPNQVFAALLYGGPFVEQRAAVAQSFMVAYLKAVRFYNDALVDGKFKGPNANAVVDLLIENTGLKDRKIYELMTAPSINPEGRVNLNSLRRDLAFFKSRPEFDADKKADVDGIVDNSFAERAAAMLGPYKPAQAPN